MTDCAACGVSLKFTTVRGGLFLYDFHFGRKSLFQFEVRDKSEFFSDDSAFLSDVDVFDGKQDEEIIKRHCVSETSSTHQRCQHKFCLSQTGEYRKERGRCRTRVKQRTSVSIPSKSF